MPDPVGEVEHQTDREPDDEPLPGTPGKRDHEVERGEDPHRRHKPDQRRLEVPGQVMIWSFGPDGKACATDPVKNGANKDNILSWEQ